VSRGRFIVIEGADGTGTTTQADRLVAALKAQGLEALRTAEPSEGAIGKLVRKRLGEGIHDDLGWQALALMFAADRLDHVAREIEPALEAGRWVVSDRYTLSSLVYQSLHVDTEWVRALNQHAPPPDVTLVLTLPLDDALARIAARGGKEEVYDVRGLQARVHGLYGDLAPTVRAELVDARGSIDDVAARVLDVLASRGWL
jgi:dTMP kinase